MKAVVEIILVSCKNYRTMNVNGFEMENTECEKYSE